MTVDVYNSCLADSKNLGLDMKFIKKFSEDTENYNVDNTRQYQATKCMRFKQPRNVLSYS